MNNLRRLTGASPSDIAIAALGIALLLAGATCIYVGQSV